MKTMVVFGASGFVGAHIVRLAHNNHYRVVAVDRAIVPGIADVEWVAADVCDRGAVMDVITEAEPAAVMNAAAIADIDYAERNRDDAWNVNVVGAENIAKAAKAVGARQLFISSDAVFSGEAERYVEEDPLEPVNFYGSTKAEAERRLLDLDPNCIIVRLSLVLGFPIAGGNSFLASLHNKLVSGTTVSAPVYETRTPIDVQTLIRCVLELVDSNRFGVFHIGAREPASRFEVTRKLAEMMGFDPDTVSSVTEPPPDRCPRHRNGFICVDKAMAALETPLLSIRETLKRACATG